MANNTKKTWSSNFRDYMAMPTGIDFELFFGSLEDHGVPLAISVDDYLRNDDQEDIVYIMEALGSELLFFAPYLRAKARGFEALRDDGIDAIFAEAEYSGSLKIVTRDQAEISGSWCRKDGVLYIVYEDLVDTTSASNARTIRSRKKSDEETAAYWLERLAERKAEMQRDAA